jgi:Fe-Mn family superoxide dismutase
VSFTRREFLKKVGLGAVAIGIVGHKPALARASQDSRGKGEMKMPSSHALPELPYAYNALEPHYDEQTLRLHHDLHHAAYVKGLNAAEDKLEAMLRSGDFAAAKAVCGELAFHGSGHILHSMFWTNMKPGGGGNPSGALADAINRSFGNFNAFRDFFLAATNAVSGSGWGVLAYRKDDDALVVLQAEKHENLTQWGVVPILVLDVWEHAYYLKYQNKRPEWTKAFMEHLVSWDDVSRRLAAPRGK